MNSNDNSEHAADARSAVSALERELRSQGAMRWLKRVGALVIAGGIAFGTWAYRERTKPPPASRFTTNEVEKRDVVEQVQSTGKLKPLKEVQIGAQVSGRVVDVHVDFNSVVKQGELLAEIDPSLFGAQVSQVRGQLEAARASIARAKAARDANRINVDRLKALLGGSVASEAEVEVAQGALDVSEADVVAAESQIAALQAQLRSASTTLGYTKIYSPISGVVVSRSVDPGQTVAASFAAPVLFVIAQDLKEMEVLADIDEADVGKLKEGMTAEVVVDAFPGEVFEGKVRQLRFSPTEVQGVVTYAAVIDVENPDLKLRPGMTATVSVKTRQAQGVVAVPNAALRYRPKPPSAEDAKKKLATGAPKALSHGQGRLYSVAGTPPNETVQEKIVQVGITDGVFTEVEGIGPGETVVTSEQSEEPRRKFLGVF